ncbi:histidinol-phosphate transaminase [Vibrio salinus]|uniref:histidinol-phosphate transaminase n=1 Tax=Vibrio salinus TaxID=2899784 RepID=UPI001E45E3EB|nr:histidinol-phosphate transaminase [Vibrio salinus]MCE0492780.1 histidinol-phosphate transaminase [Vibrio salinus]
MQTMDEIVDKLVSHYVAPLHDYNAGLSVEALKKKYNVSKIAKLGSNENPFGTPESVRKVLNEMHNLAHYPDPGCHELKVTLGQRYDTPPSHIVTGNGSEDIINMLCHAFLEDGDSVLTVTPSFGLHILYPESHGANVIISQMTDALTFDIDDLTQKLEHIRPKLFFIASPSNPVGCTLSSVEIDQLLSHQSSDTLFVFDEAYFEFAACEDGYCDVLEKLKSSGKPFILLRTLSKAYSLAGLRIGYALCATENMATYLNKVRLPFNVNRLAQKAAIAALADAKHLEKTLIWNKQARAMLFNELTKLDLNPIPSQGNFLFFSTSMPSVNIAERLLTKGVIVKPWAEKNYTNYLRVSIGTDEENQHFITSLKAILNETG